MRIKQFVSPASSRQFPGITQALPARCLRSKLLSKFRSVLKIHASSSSGEVCGFVYDNHYAPLLNVSDKTNCFYADPSALASVLSKYGEPAAIFHSHPNGCLELSEEDKTMWYYSNSTMIVGCVTDGRLRWKMYGKPGH
jgi:proteasome lid subunit RPN8/RPN11